MFLFECFLTIVLSFVWAVFLVAHRVLIHDLGVPVIIAGFWTRVIGICLLFMVIVANRELKEFINPGRLLKFALLIGLGAFCINLCSFYGVRFTTVSSGSVILKTDILFTLLASRIVLRERMHLSDWAGTCLMVVGTVALLWAKIVQMAPGLIGDALFLLSALLLTINAFIIKTKLGEMSDRVTATYNSFVTLTGFTILLFVTGNYNCSLQVFKAWTPALMTVMGGVSVAMLFLLYYRALGRLPFWLVRVLLLFTPIWGVALECSFLHKKLLPSEIAGIIVILAGAALIVLCHDQRQRAAATTRRAEEESI